jgi:hypothetical protein
MQQYTLQQRRYVLQWKLLLPLLVLCTFSIFASTEEPSLPKGEVSLRVYHLFVDAADALKKQNHGNEDVEYIPCQVNQGCTWIKRPRTETKPHFWQLVSQGTGREFEETNSNEHWLYDVPSTANSAGQHFAIAFGQGEFFETEGRENNGKKNRVIKQEYGEPDFGEKIVRNLVQEPTLSSSGYIEGRPFDGLCRDIRGRDFCSLKVRISSVKELLSYCERLWAYYGQGSGLIYQALLAEAGNKRLEDVSSLFEGQSIEEGSECKLGVVQAVKVFGKYYTFEGIGEYIERTKEDVQRLIQDDSISLPDFDETELHSSMKEAVDEKRDGEEQGDEAAPRKKRKREEERIDWEGRYNKKAAEEKGYLLLDKKCVFSNQIEVCDLLVTYPKRLLVHVKRGTDSASLNHLFGQGYASADLLSRSGSSKRIMLELLRKEVNEQIAEEMKARQQRQLTGLWQQFSTWREEKRELLTGKAYAVLRDLERFPEAKTAFKDFCIALGKFKKDPKAKRIAEQLDQYRTDLVEAHLTSCWDEVLPSMNTENITEFFNHLKARYRERYDKEADIFLSRDLEGILESENLRNFKNRLNEGLTPILNPQEQENAPNFTVIYGIITAKNAEDRNLLPLGARINLLRTVQDLMAHAREIKFDVAVKIIKEKEA